MKNKKDSKKTQIRYLLALLETTNLTFSLGTKLLEKFPNIEDLFSIPTENLIKIGIPPKDAIKLKNPNWHAVEQDLIWAEEKDHYIINIDNASYPPLLKEIPNPPLLLFIKGNLELLKSPQVAIVGSRNPTPVGAEIAFAFAKELTKIGLVITSGFAAGIDAASHKGAISNSGQTIAVMGTGLNKLYPLYHSVLAQKILGANGALISEFPLETKGNAWHFPLRNRIISGLSLGTLVVEAALRSGSLITARLANEQGREVFAIPGSIYNPLAQGCHYLIHQGAKLTQHPTDILEELGGIAESAQLQLSETSFFNGQNKLDRKHKKLLDCIGFEITTVDILIARTNLSVQQISTMLLELELRGFTKQMAGGHVRCLKT
jgi:DNA processing protein